MGSMMIPHVLSLMSSLSPSSTLTFPTLTPGSKGAKGSWYLGLGVTDKAPRVRPWKAFSKQTISDLAGLSVNFSFANFRTNLSAPSLASVPELAKKTLPDELAAVDDSGVRPRPPCSLVSETSRLAQGPAHSLW